MENFILEETILTPLECDEIINLIEAHRDKMIDKQQYGETDNVACKVLILADLVAQETEKAKEIDNLVFSKINKFLNDTVLPYFSTKEAYVPIANFHDSGYELREITGATRPHQDGAMPTNNPKYTQTTYRVGTIVLSLTDSDDFLHFPIQNASLKLTKGKIIFFPPFWTHPHHSSYGGKTTYRIQTWLYASDFQ